MLQDRSRLEDVVRAMERLTYQSTTYEPAMRGLADACLEIERLAEGDRAADLARDVREALSDTRAGGLKRRIYTTVVGERVEALREYVEMAAEQGAESPGAGRPEARR